MSNHYKNPLPKISASSQLQNFSPETLMSDNPVIWHSNPPFKKPETLYVDFETAQTVYELSILPQEEVERAPASFTFFGSNDKKEWFELLSVKKSLKKPTINEWLKYQIKHPKPFSYYRIVITENYGDPNLVTIRSLKMGIKEKNNSSDIVLIKSKSNIINNNHIEKANVTNSVVMINRSYNGVKLDVHAQKNVWLVWREPYGLNWNIKVDGKQQEYTQADVVFIAIPISSGSHVVEIEYTGNAHFKTKYSIVIGLGIIGLILIFTLVFI